MNTDLEGKSRFLEILLEKDTSLAAELMAIKREGLENWVHLLHPDAGSHNGYPHFLNVERIANQLIPDEKKLDFSPIEIFLLLSSIFLHDIGKILDEKQPLIFTNPALKCNLEGCRDVKKHSCLSRIIILQHGNALGITNERVAEYCSLLAFSHGIEKPEDFFSHSDFMCIPREQMREFNRPTDLTPYGRIRVPLLCSILRIADECDNQWPRAVRGEWNATGGIEELGKAFRKFIEGMEFSREGKCIILHVPELPTKNNQMYVERIISSRKQIDTIIQEWRTPLMEIGVVFDDVFIEHGNRLIKSSLEDGGRPFIDVLKPPAKRALRKLYPAVKKLFFGSLGYSRFTWFELEAVVGRPLLDTDRWLIRQMGRISPYLRILVEEDAIALNIKFSHDKEPDVQKMILGDPERRENENGR